MRVFLLSAAFVCAALPAFARAPASVDLGNRKAQCRAMTCACGVCSQCRTQAEKEACAVRVGGDVYRESGESGTYHLNDDGELVKEDADD